MEEAFERPAQPTGRASSSWFHRHPKTTISVLVLSFYTALDLIVSRFVLHEPPYPFSPYCHHDLPKNVVRSDPWGQSRYPTRTNSLGFRDAAPRQVSLEADGPRVLVIGDSFTEGVGVPYEQTFAGFLDREARPLGIEVLNAGVTSHSPKMYYLKVRHLLDRVGLEFHHLYVLIDISDIQDEINYEHYEPQAPSLSRRCEKYLKYNSLTYRHVLRKVSPIKFGKSVWRRVRGIPKEKRREPDWGPRYNEIRDRWTFDQACYDEWGERGLGLAKASMAKLTALCQRHGISVTLVVYPWPAQIEQRDLECRQVTAWRAFAQEQGVAFLDLFPLFINGVPAEDVVAAHFIAGDCHWNAAGHAVVGQRLFDHLRAHVLKGSGDPHGAVGRVEPKHF